MQRAILLTILIGIAVFLGGMLIVNMQTRAEYRIFWGTPTPTPTPPERSYTEPTISMSYAAFEKICSKALDAIGQEDADSASTSETAAGQSFHLVLGRNKERVKSKCYGSFFFYNDKLERISR